MDAMWIDFVMKALTAASFLAPLFCFSFLMTWEPIFVCFVPGKLGLEIIYHTAALAYVCVIIGPTGHLDEVSLLLLGITINFVWVVLQIQQNFRRIRFARPVMICLLALFLVFANIYFWIIQTGFKLESGYRRSFGRCTLLLLLLHPGSSVVHRFRNRVPDDAPVPYRIKMGMSLIGAVTSAYGVWSQYKEGFYEDDNLCFLFIFSCISTLVACLQTIIRFVGPLWVFDMLRRLSGWTAQKINQLLASSCNYLFPGDAPRPGGGDDGSV